MKKEKILLRRFRLSNTQNRETSVRNKKDLSPTPTLSSTSGKRIVDQVASDNFPRRIMNPPPIKPQIQKSKLVPISQKAGFFFKQQDLVQKHTHIPKRCFCVPSVKHIKTLPWCVGTGILLQQRDYNWIRQKNAFLWVCVVCLFGAHVRGIAEESFLTCLMVLFLHFCFFGGGAHAFFSFAPEIRFS